MAITRGWTIWLTGPPAAGKTTLARALQARLGARGVPAVVLDSDAVRPVLAPGAGYGPGERDAVYARLVALAGLLADEGANVIVAATAHRRAYRDAARASLATFAEVWVRCPVEVCRARDPKGLYAQAAAGAVVGLPGAQVAYEPPASAEVVVDTDQEPVEQAVERIIAALPFLGRQAQGER